ncbi:hypothetical protein [Paraburkholderia adhaesiva]|uniref:hypothetical protein n=1 Tax=Paraburkholderia adhaesiva TaxID=2883244 RepID=UPI001F427FB3|nr:hypothetical protein [Paraburkholderia adhaesiva]
MAAAGSMTSIFPRKIRTETVFHPSWRMTATPSATHAKDHWIIGGFRIDRGRQALSNTYGEKRRIAGLFETHEDWFYPPAIAFRMTHRMSARRHNGYDEISQGANANLCLFDRAATYGPSFVPIVLRIRAIQRAQRIRPARCLFCRY